MKRLAFGVKACPGIFQRLMSSLLARIRGIAVLLDDIVVSGSDVAEHEIGNGFKVTTRSRVKGEQG